MFYPCHKKYWIATQKWELKLPSISDEITFYLANQLKSANLELLINLWIITFGNIKTLNNFFLDLNIPTNNRTILYYPRDGTSLKWIYKISFELTPAILEKGTFCLFLTLLTTYLNEETKLAIQILNNGKTEYFPPGNAEPCLTHLRHSIHIR